MKFWYLLGFNDHYTTGIPCHFLTLNNEEFKVIIVTFLTLTGMRLMYEKVKMKR